MAGEVTTGELIAFVGSSLPEVSKNPPIAAINTPAPPKIMALLPLDFELSFFVSLMFNNFCMFDSYDIFSISSFASIQHILMIKHIKTASIFKIIIIKILVYIQIA
jgi:hypothetical protein